MIEASSGSSRAEVERRMINRSMEDEEFRQRLLDDPKGARPRHKLCNTWVEFAWQIDRATRSTSA